MHPPRRRTKVSPCPEKTRCAPPTAAASVAASNSAPDCPANGWRTAVARCANAAAARPQSRGLVWMKNNAASTTRTRNCAGTNLRRVPNAVFASAAARRCFFARSAGLANCTSPWPTSMARWTGLRGRMFSGTRMPTGCCWAMICRGSLTCTRAADCNGQIDTRRSSWTLCTCSSLGQ